MIVFDLFIDIESTHEFSDLFFQIFMISSENHGPVKVEVTVYDVGIYRGLPNYI